MGAIRLGIRNSIVALTLLSFTGCTALRPIEDFSPSRIREKVEVGERVRIVTLANVAYELEVTEVGVDHLVGRTASGKRYRVMFEAMKSIEVEELKVGTTVVGTIATIGTIIVLIGTVIFIKALDDLDDE